MADGRALLLTAIRQEEELDKIVRLRRLSAEEWEALLIEAGRHGLVPLLFHTLKPYYPDPQVPSHIQERLRSVYYNSAARNMRLYRQLVNILAKFASEAIPVILLKGAHLAWTVYPNMALRPMADIDLLVRHENFARVHQLLIEDGYSTFQDVSWPRQLPSYTKKNYLPVEIHAHLKSLSTAEDAKINLIWERAEKITLDKTEAYTLCPEDLFLHLCLHTCIQHNFENGLLACLDTAVFVNHYNGKLNWDTVWCRAEQWGIERAVYLMFAATEKMIGFPMPEKIKQALEPNRESAKALALAEHLIFEEYTELSPHLSPFFENQGWGEKFKLVMRRIFIAPELDRNGREEKHTRKNFKRYWFYFYRPVILVVRHAKTIWRGLRSDPRTITAIENRNKKNSLKAWLTHTEEP